MVLLCYDGSPTARHAISVAHAALGHKPATVLHVWQPPTEFIDPDWFAGVGTYAGPPIAKLEGLALQHAEAVADEGSELARSAGFAADARAEPSHGRVWRTVVDVADELNADLIVVGARGLSTVQSVLLGSVSNAVVHHCKRPVLVVPRADATHDTRGMS
jgi:nucleotide-binding universal stress UspA family protein